MLTLASECERGPWVAAVEVVAETSGVGLNKAREILSGRIERGVVVEAGFQRRGLVTRIDARGKSPAWLLNVHAVLALDSRRRGPSAPPADVSTPDPVETPTPLTDSVGVNPLHPSLKDEGSEGDPSRIDEATPHEFVRGPHHIGTRSLTGLSLALHEQEHDARKAPSGPAAYPKLATPLTDAEIDRDHELVCAEMLRATGKLMLSPWDRGQIRTAMRERGTAQVLAAIEVMAGSAQKPCWKYLETVLTGEKRDPASPKLSAYAKGRNGPTEAGTPLPPSTTGVTRDQNRSAVEDALRRLNAQAGGAGG